MSHAQTYFLNTSLFSLHAVIYEYIKIYINYDICWYLYIFHHFVSNQDNFMIKWLYINIYVYINIYHSFMKVIETYLRKYWDTFGQSLFG